MQEHHDEASQLSLMVKHYDLLFLESNVTDPIAEDR